VWRQVARPFSERLPSLQGLMGEGAALRTIVLLALAMTALVVVVARVASGWLRDAGLSLVQPGGEAGGAGYQGPAELEPAVQQFGELQQSKSRWIEAQRRFLADATHQMRTPMAVLRTQLQSAIAGDVQVAEALHQMLHTVDRASNLANQLLSLSKVEQLKRMGELPSVDLNATAREAVKELAPLIAAKRLDFALEGPDELMAPGDAALLGELVRNLLANAIHHAPVHGRLGLLLRHSTGRRELLVWDEGPGIDDAVRERLFQPFSAGKGGVGLGLSICRQIAESMGAEVTLFNRMDQGRVVGVDALVAWEE
jgi:two-component system sensor histidine kinase TctE